MSILVSTEKDVDGVCFRNYRELTQNQDHIQNRMKSKYKVGFVKPIMFSFSGDYIMRGVDLTPCSSPVYLSHVQTQCNKHLQYNENEFSKITNCGLKI